MRLKELRQIKGVSQKNVAEFIGCTPMTYSRYENENRQPDINTLCLLAKYFGTGTDEIIGYEKQ